METNTCTTIVLVLLWLYLCIQAVGSLVALIEEFDAMVLLSSITTLSTVLLGVCLWQCHKAGYLVSPMTWYHWVILALLVLLQVVPVVMVLQERIGLHLSDYLLGTSKYYIFGITGVLAVTLGILGGTLYCGWKCNLFCRPCCKSQYVCYGSAIVVVLLILTLVAAIASLIGIYGGKPLNGRAPSELSSP
uniref:Membrane protein, putative n=1 Tax=Babesia bovis TaxID=5865 RepID=S6CAI0_BABBO|nr:membrane protein, putative [Babesia bovis]